MHYIKTDLTVIVPRLPVDKNKYARDGAWASSVPVWSQKELSRQNTHAKAIRIKIDSCPKCSPAVRASSAGWRPRPSAAQAL